MSWTFKDREASFFAGTTRRTSTTRGKSNKSMKWPHRFLAPEQLAHAGFFYNPSAKENDNVTCFLCEKSIVGWEEDDNPIDEHLKLSPNCGWAIITSIQSRNEELLNEYPGSDRMVEARRATFADRWPHEEKKGWKCKTKQLVEAGWYYQPTPETDDWVTCAYCELGLDGWEPSDDPTEQHYKRSPDCTFFALLDNHPDKPTTKKKATKARKPRASKTSRLSEMSQITTADEGSTSIMEEDISVLTQKKPTRARKPRASKSSQATDVLQGLGLDVDAASLLESGEQESAPPEKKVAKGRKPRASKASHAADLSHMSVSVLEDMADAPELSGDAPAVQDAKPQKRGRKPRASKASKSKEVVDGHIAADACSGVAREFGEVEVSNRDNTQAPDSAREPEDDDFEVKVPIKRTTKPRKGKPAKNDSSTLDMDAEVEFAPSKPPPPKARNVRYKKASVLQPQDIDVVVDVLPNGPESARPISKKRKSSISDADIADQVTPKAKKRNISHKNDSMLADGEEQLYGKLDSGCTSEAAVEPKQLVSETLASPVQRSFGQEVPERDAAVLEPSQSLDSDTAKCTAKVVSTVELERLERLGQQVTTVPESAQSSDAENHPPTPRTKSPLKRNIVASAQSTEAWRSADIDELFAELPEPSEHVSTALTTLEKAMTVEDWIRHNAGLAEDKLKSDCERMVGLFERQGGIAMRALQGIYNV